MSITIESFAPGERLQEFATCVDPWLIGAPGYISPLRMEVKDRLNPKKNPFWQHADGRLFLAMRGGTIVGRISAQIDREHLRIHNDGAGFFGFLDSIDDQEVVDLLLQSAHDWLKANGATVMRGPFSLSINEETGVLVDGFEHPPSIAMPHHIEYQHKLIEASSVGLEQAMDFWAWKYTTEEPTRRVRRAWEQIQALPEVRFRDVDPSRMDEEIDILLEIFNDAWKDNWGFVPSTEAEARHIASEMKMILDPRIAFFVEVKGEPVGMVISLPNLPAMIHDLEGKLFPFGWAKLLWRMKVKQVNNARLVMLGLKSSIRGKKRYGALSTAMYAEVAYRGMRAGYEWGEVGWTLESNRAINLGIKAMRGKVYKIYRVYERPIN